MSIDYDEIAGIGIELDQKLLRKLEIKFENEFENQIFGDDISWALEQITGKFDFIKSDWACDYDGDDRYYLFIKGKNFKEIKENIFSFKCFCSNNLGIELMDKDLRLISDLRIL